MEICISCEQNRSSLDKDGVCIFCRKGYGGKPKSVDASEERLINTKPYRPEKNRKINEKEDI